MCTELNCALLCCREGRGWFRASLDSIVSTTQVQGRKKKASKEFLPLEKKQGELFAVMTVRQWDAECYTHVLYSVGLASENYQMECYQFMTPKYVRNTANQGFPKTWDNLTFKWYNHNIQYGTPWGKGPYPFEASDLWKSGLTAVISVSRHWQPHWRFKGSYSPKEDCRVSLQSGMPQNIWHLSTLWAQAEWILQTQNTEIPLGRFLLFLSIFYLATMLGENPETRVAEWNEHCIFRGRTAPSSTISWETLGNSLNFSEPQFPRL